MEGLEEIFQGFKDAILESIGEGISIIGKDMKIVWANPVIEKWAGRLEDIRKRYCYQVYQKRDDLCQNCPSVKTLRTGKTEKARQYGYDTRGKIKYFEFISAPIRDEQGEIIAVVELATDLTEKIELEHKLEQTKKNLQAIFDSIGDGVSVIDRDYRLVRVNQGILKIYNKRDFSNLLGRKCFAEYYQSESICENCPAQKTFEDGKPHHITKIRHQDKGRVVLDISTFPIKDDRGEVVQVIKYIKDVTATIKLEDQLLYQERLAGVGELAAGIAHEIRNPLGNITAAAQFCLDKYKIHQMARKHLKIILRNAENANKIVKDLLDFARPTEISFKLGHISEVISSACNLVKARCSRQRVRLTRRCSRQLPQVLLDEKQLEAAFLNFILNALEAMPNGGRLTITAYPDSQNNEVEVRFSDTGEGISEEKLNEIFTPFFTTKEEGVGLGLCLAHQVISYHKGKINIKSKVGQGTEVKVMLPILREEKDKTDGKNPDS